MEAAILRGILENLNLAKFTCDYCDVRIEDTISTVANYRNGELLGFDVKPSLGAFIRVKKAGQWRYQATTNLSTIGDQIEQLLEKFPKTHHEPTRIQRSPATKVAVNCSEWAAHRTPAPEKQQLCESYLPVLREARYVQDHELTYADRYKIKYFKSSDGRFTQFDTNGFSLMTSYTLRDGSGIFADRHEEFSRDFQSLENRQNRLKQALEESSRFLHAEPVMPGKYKVVMAPSVVGVFAHESFGHKSEADFMLSDELALKEWEIGKTVGSPVLSIVDDGSRGDNIAFCPLDDEGAEGQKTYLIKNGVLTGRLHSMDTATSLRESPTGNGRSINFEFEPIPRMTTTYVEPGEISFEQMISGVREGIYVKTFKHGSGLSTFTIAPLRSYQIRDGKIAEPIRVSVISGSVFETLKNVEACANDFDLYYSMVGGCGKIEQWPLPVGFGGPSVLVGGMQVS